MNEIKILEISNALWDALRMECCVTKLNAHRIVMVNKEDVIAAVKRVAVDKVLDLPTE